MGGRSGEKTVRSAHKHIPVCIANSVVIKVHSSVGKKDEVSAN